jgi:hypothetical protein
MQDLTKNEINSDIDDNEPLTKPKKIRSAKQIEAFKTTMEKRALNIETRKHEKLVKASSLLVEENNKKLLPPLAKTIKKKQVQESDTEDSETEEEIIIVKAQPKKKPKKKKVKKIIIEDSDDSSSDSGSDAPATVSVQRNRSYSNLGEITINPNNYFI